MDLQKQIEEYLSKNHRYIYPHEAVKLSEGIMKLIQKYIAEENLQKPF